jgi:hypothetical protein
VNNEFVICRMKPVLRNLRYCSGMWSGGAIYIMSIYCVKHVILIACGCLWMFRYSGLIHTGFDRPVWFSFHIFPVNAGCLISHSSFLEWIGGALLLCGFCTDLTENTEKNRIHWVHPINEKREEVGLFYTPGLCRCHLPYPTIQV